MYRLAALQSRHLWNDERRKLHLGTMLAGVHQRFRSLLWSHHTEVGDYAAMHRFRVIEIDDLLYEIGTVALEQLICLSVWCRVQPADQRVILLGTRGESKSIKRAVVRRTCQLIPRLVTGMLFLRQRQAFQIFFTQQRNQLCVGVEWNIFRIPYGVKIRNQWNRDPVAGGHSVIAADDHATFSSAATAQLCRSVGAHS